MVFGNLRVECILTICIGHKMLGEINYKVERKFDLKMAKFCNRSPQIFGQFLLLNVFWNVPIPDMRATGRSKRGPNFTAISQKLSLPKSSFSHRWKEYEILSKIGILGAPYSLKQYCVKKNHDIFLKNYIFLVRKGLSEESLSKFKKFKTNHEKKQQRRPKSGLAVNGVLLHSHTLAHA